MPAVALFSVCHWPISYQGSLHRVGDQDRQIDSWCFEPSQPHRITSGLNTNFTLSSSYSFHMSSYHKSCGFFFQPIYIPRALNTVTCTRQGGLFYSAGLHRNHVLATANTGEIERGFKKMQVNGPVGDQETNLEGTSLRAKHIDSMVVTTDFRVPFSTSLLIENLLILFFNNFLRLKIVYIPSSETSLVRCVL